MMSFFKRLVLLTSMTMFTGAATAYFGNATFYDTGLGACGVQSKDSDFIVALSSELYDNGAHCWKHLTVTYEGKSIDVTVVDRCAGCNKYSIDLSPSAFSALAPKSVGRMVVDWSYA
ncbi:hypothetical protein SERLA73DRAFT_96788 [Serpula lacrymans var. lacrymans S7.3]|uniref:RlpA-like protein double-psi beta-barrel domain-containing protein n=2 Tax=Serpula lacrymans var. lacrymans TaxID=341189 RepID=F8QBJ4_SERL3|nr:uncharacterized protein SERLADRAFT_363828 [Serpula lacrymans var. lacrymans S7.9]EGN94580.1 hypothetical protein SERLA73DRAFT_96788 [Serpula lacrymans var. lacrymans S7.3]EGO20056.1 hypothetical protein SERLADRAFT_363828 [Serpula lacrymans var. lacrymans S7.9]